VAWPSPKCNRSAKPARGAHAQAWGATQTVQANKHRRRGKQAGRQAGRQTGRRARECHTAEAAYTAP